MSFGVFGFRTGFFVCFRFCYLDTDLDTGTGTDTGGGGGMVSTRRKLGTNTQISQSGTPNDNRRVRCDEK